MAVVSIQSMRPHHAVTSGVCVLCDGPCRMPMTLPPIHEKYPFMTAAQIEATQPPVQGPEQPRMARRGNHGRPPGENNAHQPGENR